MNTCNKDPLVSVVIPCYNHDGYVQECLRSVIEQDYDNIELIVIDDGSTDHSCDRIKELAEVCDKRFKRFEFRSRENRGLCATLNEAIEWCRGVFFSAIASDDIMLPFKTSCQVEYFGMYPSCGAVFGGAYIIDDAGKVIKTRKGKPRTYGFRALFLLEHSLSAPTQMIRTNLLREVGMYPENLLIEDWFMWLKLTERGERIDELRTILVKYRRHDRNVSSNVLRMDRARGQLIDIFSNSPYYSRAKGVISLSAAMDIQPFSKLKSLRYLFKALKSDFRVLSDKRFYRYLIKLFIPKKLIK